MSKITAPPASWEWLGEPLAVDFANTLRRRGRTYEELLVSGADLARWSRRESKRVPVLNARAIAPRLDEARAVRDDVFAVLHAATSGRRLPSEATQRINARAREHPVVAQLGARPGASAKRVVGAPERLDDLLARVADAAIRLVGDAHSGIALCDAPSCGQFFIRERSNQRWCGPACGNRARVARHAHA